MPKFTQVTQVTQSDQELDPGLPVRKPGQVAPFWVHDELGDYFSEPQVGLHNPGAACSEDTLPPRSGPPSPDTPLSLIDLQPPHLPLKQPIGPAVNT